MSTKKNYCPDGMRRNPKTGECESKKAKKTRRKKDNIIQQITNNPIVNSISSGVNIISTLDYFFPLFNTLVNITAKQPTSWWNSRILAIWKT